MQSKFTFERSSLCFPRRKQKDFVWQARNCVWKCSFGLGSAWSALGQCLGASCGVPWERLPRPGFPPEAVRPPPPLPLPPQLLLRSAAAWLLSPAATVGEPPLRRACFCLKPVRFLAVFQPPEWGFQAPSQATARISCRSWSVACIYKSYLFAWGTCADTVSHPSILLWHFRAQLCVVEFFW